MIGKGNKQRAIPLPDRVLEELRAHGLPPTGPVFTRVYGEPGPLTAGRVSHLCGDHLHSLGIPESLHKLRHFYGTSMYAASKDIVMVQRMLGHASAQTTSGYVAFSQEAAHAAAAMVAGRHRKPSPEVPQAGHLPAVGLRLVPPVGEGDPAPADTALPTGVDAVNALELDVVRLLVAGMRNSQIGAALGMTADVVGAHLRRIGQKLGVAGRVGIATTALRSGLVA